MEIMEIINFLGLFGISISSAIIFAFAAKKIGKILLLRERNKTLSILIESGMGKSEAELELSNSEIKILGQKLRDY